ncbi:hypothetical protein [Kitasatospora sp. DSM 101779]|jgi:hypothetical protein|uniref:hypothetical protein n=1 Tax=Kitasatospora sp. DSM 101779 TaxID=2853165 RepID=UPI0021D9561D|nr:hypothetical protein [Kitasatospora sp. DSM 101779]MCU7823340.1 hypothetical protein [Kitasatospora sp. DSM 101779]
MRNRTQHTADRRSADRTDQDGPRHRGPVAKAVRNVGIMIDTAARVVFLGRDGVSY